MIGCEPTANNVVCKVAIAEPLRVPVPSVIAASMKLTVPVGVPEAVFATVAVNITDCPSTDGLLFDVTDVVVAAGCTVPVMT